MRKADCPKSDIALGQLLGKPKYQPELSSCPVSAGGDGLCDNTRIVPYKTYESFQGFLARCGAFLPRIQVTKGVAQKGRRLSYRKTEEKQSSVFRKHL